MSICTVEHLSHGFGDRGIFDDVSFRLLKGEHVGLIGANGEGKSTFMSILTSKLQPEEGRVIWSSKVRVGYLDQHSTLEKGLTIRQALQRAYQYLFDDEAEMLGLYEAMSSDPNLDMDSALERIGILQDTLDHHDFYIIDKKIDEVASALGLNAIGLEKDVDQLSGGQRSKVLLTKLLLEKPDILLLDEPTNYLDEEHIVWLKRYLLTYENAFILISHDMPFLNEVVNLIYHVENRKLTRYVGNYDEFLRVYEQNKRLLESAYGRQQSEISRLEDFVARNKANVATANMAKSRQKKLDKMDRIELAPEKPQPVFNFKMSRTSGKLIVETNDLVIGYESPLTRPLKFTIERGQKIALTGANGLGKTTLLKSILGLIEPLDGKIEKGEYLFIGYFEQEQKKNTNLTCIDDVWQTFPSFSQLEIRNALAKVGLTRQQLESKISVLSGGEQAKVRLCKILHTPSNVLVLDEPTNHLDIDAKEELKRALIDYKGTVLLVCHEPEFYQDIVSEVWNVESWTTKIV
ncbi:MAG: ABC-F family ATP-binding cassette domain-containing protein [Erysipelotrichaceae bacterium]|nr:ABC-F family ATP-binding cassette domain-containing protein [Erysipelotrichaceae bacterium]